MSIIFKQNNCNARALVEFQNKCITNLYRIFINSSKEKATLYTFSSSAVTQIFGGGRQEMDEYIDTHAHLDSAHTHWFAPPLLFIFTLLLLCWNCVSLVEINKE